MGKKHERTVADFRRVATAFRIYFSIRGLSDGMVEEFEERISEIQDKTVYDTGNQDLVRVLKMWRQQQQQRDIEMIRNIYEYCRENNFDTGVFLVGASHKMSITKEIENYSNNKNDLINWSFAFSEQTD